MAIVEPKDQRAIALYTGGKPILVFRNGNIAGKYIAKEGEIKQWSLITYAYRGGQVYPKSNRYGKKLVVRFANEELTKKLEGNRILVLDEEYRTNEFTEKDRMSNGQPTIHEEQTRTRQERLTEVEKVVKAVDGWKDMTYSALKEITGCRATDIEDILKREGCLPTRRYYKTEFKTSLSKMLARAYKNFDRNTVKEVVMEVLNSYKIPSKKLKEELE